MSGMEETLVTIILTTLNSERFVACSIESCLNQTYRNLELLVVGGGPWDRMIKNVSRHDDPHLRMMHTLLDSAKRDFQGLRHRFAGGEMNSVKSLDPYAGHRNRRQKC